MNGAKIAKLLKRWQSGRDYLTDGELRELREGLVCMRNFYMEMGERIQAGGLMVEIASVGNAIYARENL